MSLERRIVDIRKDWRRYCVIGPRMAVDFHVINFREHDPIAGLETHYRQRPSYMRDKPADFDKCWLTDAPCWCDGTSLYATEVLLPQFDPDDLEPFWRVLEHEHDKRDRDAFGDVECAASDRNVPGSDGAQGNVRHDL